MRLVVYLFTILALLNTTTLARNSHFNPYKSHKKVVRKHIKKKVKRKRRRVKHKRRVKRKRVHRKKIHKRRHHKKRFYKNHKKRKNRLSKSLNRIYKRVLKRTNINRRALKKAFLFYKNNRVRKGLSSKYLAIADYTKTARNKRLYIINLKNGRVYRHKVAHGKYSGSIGGKVYRSSNRKNTNMTPYGFFKVGSRVQKTRKKRYKYLSVRGLERSNRRVGLPPRMGGRDIIVHPAKYVNYGGRSHGCFSICPQDRYAVFAKLKKALLYSYTGR
jgi:hypothetical protein